MVPSLRRVEQCSERSRGLASSTSTVVLLAFAPGPYADKLCCQFIAWRLDESVAGQISAEILNTHSS